LAQAAMRAAAAALLLSLLFQGCDQKKPGDIRVPDDKVTYIKPKPAAAKPAEKKAEPAKEPEKESEEEKEKESEEKEEKEKESEAEEKEKEAEAEEEKAEKEKDEKEPEAAILAALPHGRASPLFKSFLETAAAAAPVQTNFAQARSHGQSWSAVELEDSSAQKRLMAMGNIIDADLNPDPIKVQDDINRAWDMMQAQDRHFLVDQQHHLDHLEARAAYVPPAKRSKPALHLLNVASRVASRAPAPPAPPAPLPTLD